MQTSIGDVHDEAAEVGTGGVILTVVLPTAVTVLVVAALGVWLLARGGYASRSTGHPAGDPRTHVPAQAVAADSGSDGTVNRASIPGQPRPATRPPYVVYLVERAEQQAALGIAAGSPDALVVVVPSEETLAATLALVQVLAMGASEEPVAREVRVVDLRH